ncbi:hypothetical protein K501DRAFT_299412 [Backusella circina FSU 941]|nr:hypothetical protein K501DRAFT_299412 [Backusella circina FSU 941]
MSHPPQQESTNPSVDELLASVCASNNDTKWNEIVKKLDTLKESQLVSYTSEQLDPLSVLNPVNHSVAYLYFITARCQQANAETGVQLFQLLNYFIDVFDQIQVQLAPKKFALIAPALQHLARVLNQPTLPIRPLAVAIERYAKTPNTLTSLHPAFVLIDIKNNDINIRGYLEYHYYSAIAYIGNKNFDRALDFLSLVISAPAKKSVSAIQIEAYKKFVLVSLIKNAKLSPLPKYTVNGVEKVCKAQATPYLELARAFDDTNIQMYEEAVNKSMELWRSDKHMGLVKQCYQSIRRKRIKELAKVYITVSLENIVPKMGQITLEELERTLVEMIYQKEISASLSVTDQGIKMVHFDDSDDVLQPALNLEQRIFKAISVNDRVAAMDKLEGLNKDFQAKYMVLGANGGQVGSVSYDENIDLHSDDDGQQFA